MYKTNIYLALLLIITMNCYVVYTTYHKEAFVGKAVKGIGKVFKFMSNIFNIVGDIIIKIFRQVFNLIPVKAVRDHYKKETNTSNLFKFFLLVGWATFKLILLIGVMPFVLMFVVMMASTVGSGMVMKKMYEFVKFMFKKPKLDLNAITLSNNQKLADASEQISALEKKINNLQSR